MAAMSILIPVPKGKAEDFRKFAKESMTDRHHHHRASRQKHGYSREKAWLHKTPHGEFVIIYLEAEDMQQATEAFVKSQDPHDVWLKENFMNHLGRDITKGVPPGEEGEVLFDYEA